MPNITLERFMIFNSSEGCTESHEGEKLLYHWTKRADEHKVSLAEQIDDVCLCDASVNISNRLSCDIDQFSNNSRGGDSTDLETSSTSKIETSAEHETFGQSSTSGSLESSEKGKSLVLTFENTLVLIVEVENKQSIWMAIHVAPPTNASTNSSEAGSIDGAGNSSTSTDLSCIPTNAIECVMNNIYARFCLLNGTFQMIADETRDLHPKVASDERIRGIIRERTRKICEDYFNSVLPDIHLNSIVSNIATLYNYILYLDLNPLVLMKVNSFINHLVCLNALIIRHTIVIFNDQLLWSSLNMYDTRLVYNYLVSILIRDALQEELSKEVDKVRRIKEELPINLTELNDMQEESSIPTSDDSSRQFKVQNTRKLTKFYLTVFRSSNNMTLGLFLSKPTQKSLIQKCEQILISDSRLGVIPLASLAQSVGQSFLKSNASHHSNQVSSTQNTVVPNSVYGWRKSNNPVYLKGIIPPEQKYVFMDRLDVSIVWSLSIDMQNKEYLLLNPLDPASSREVQSSSSHLNNRKLRLIRYLIELEPDLDQLKRQNSGNIVREFLGRTTNDSWLTVTNSRYRTIYSVHDVRNSGLTEALQSANNLKSIFIGNRRRVE